MGDARELEAWKVNCPDCGVFKITVGAMRLIDQHKCDISARLPFVHRTARQASEPLLITEHNILGISYQQQTAEGGGGLTAA